MLVLERISTLSMGYWPCQTSFWLLSWQNFNFIHLIPVTIYILQVFKISLSKVSKFWFFCKPFKLYMYIWSTKIVWRIFLSLLMECIVHNILLILIMRIQILLSSFLNTAKNSNVNSIYLFPIYRYANNVI